MNKAFELPESTLASFLMEPFNLIFVPLKSARPFRTEVPLI